LRVVLLLSRLRLVLRCLGLLLLLLLLLRPRLCLGLVLLRRCSLLHWLISLLRQPYRVLCLRLSLSLCLGLASALQTSLLLADTVNPFVGIRMGFELLILLQL